MIRCLALVLLMLTACGSAANTTASPPAQTTTTAGQSAPAQATTAAGQSTPATPADVPDPAEAEQEPLPDGVRVQPIAGEQQGVSFPVAIAFLPDGRWLVTEKGGYGGPTEAQIHLFDRGGQKQAQPFATLEVDSTFERGLLGITADPQFAENHYVYVYYSKPGEPVVNTTLRYTERDGIGTEPTVIFEAPVLTGAGNHNGGNLHFGPDGKLYISIGENARPAFSQDPQSPYGKILRLNPDGSVPEDNPFAPAPTWAYGLRNPFDFTFDAQTGNLWATDNGPGCDDELNLIGKGQNYGWGPGNQCGRVREGSVGPLLRWSDPEAVTGVIVYTGDAIAAWKDSLLICAYSGGALYRARLTPDRRGVADVKRVALPEGIGCGTDIEVAQDGSIYMNEPPNIYHISGGG
ncbi:MAG TPA: PQQ-dependent sugar dehydrogenase [Herpetosiphonaceae bacterium]